MTARSAAGRRAWFRDARLGMFIHWGPYAGAGRGEMIHAMHGLTKPGYEDYARRFRAERYDPRAWARLAKAAGCRYMVLTTKHNDGFCLFRTSTTAWNALRWGPGRDLIAPYVRACRAAGLKVGFYFSLHDYWQPGGVPKGYAKAAHARYTPDERRGYHALVRAQLRELGTQYGRIDLLFYDGGLPDDPAGAAARPINAMVRKLQPHIVINNRSNNPEDYDTPENFIQPSGGNRLWETCMTLGLDWWGYHDHDGPFRTVPELVHNLRRVAAGGGNLCLNVGPRADGTIPAFHARPLQALGRWLRRHGEAVYGSRRDRCFLTTCGHATFVGNRAYVWAFRHEAPECVFRGLLSPAKRITCLTTGQPVRFAQRGAVVRMLGLPRRAPDPVATVYRVEVRGKLRSEF